MTRREQIGLVLAGLVVAVVGGYSEMRDSQLMSSLQQGQDFTKGQLNSISNILGGKLALSPDTNAAVTASAAAAKIDELSKQVAQLKPHIVNVENSQSPFPVPIGRNIVFAASAADRDTKVILPSATGSGDTDIVKKTDSNPHSIIVTPQGSDTIDGQREFPPITIQNDAVPFVDRGRGQWAVE